MKTLFKLFLVVLITVQIAQAQNTSTVEMDEIHTIFDETYTTDANTTLVLDLSNTAAQVFKSKDDNVRIIYTMEFKNYRKKIVEERLKSAVVKGKKENNKITYTSKSRNSRYYRQYHYEDILVGRLYKKQDTSKTQKPISRKSLDAIYNQIKYAERDRLRELYGTIKVKPRVKKWKKSDKLQITRVEIYIPDNIHVRATIENSQLVFADDFSNQFTFNARNSKLRFKSIGNNLSNFDVDNGYFSATEINAGSYSFANTKAVTIGKVSNSLVNSEFTKVELGEIGRNNKIIDFNSKYIIHNFHNDFYSLNLETDYTEINLFSPENMDYYLETFGFDTMHYKKGTTTKFKSNRKNKPSKMMVIGNENYPNKIKINTTHGIIRFGEKRIDFGEEN
ncbi:hypothetical protein [uncultured Winogradskyella sp.]|uniref:hypothetical protein n=1 Tax=uncultured Winogradskyella sp. TaxID=395353 RepID=UPI0030DAA4CF|tara:strand:+ start:39292 stop:40467 length:1176 start_codon:yes stop_codon:yes gene_type:complete